MKELMAELLECTCIQQGREQLAQEIIEKHLIALGEHLAATQVVAQEVTFGISETPENSENTGVSSTN